MQHRIFKIMIAHALYSHTLYGGDRPDSLTVHNVLIVDWLVVRIFSCRLRKMLVMQHCFTSNTHRKEKQPYLSIFHPTHAPVEPASAVCRKHRSWQNKDAHLHAYSEESCSEESHSSCGLAMAEIRTPKSWSMCTCGWVLLARTRRLQPLNWRSNMILFWSRWENHRHVYRSWGSWEFPPVLVSLEVREVIDEHWHPQDQHCV